MCHHYNRLHVLSSLGRGFITTATLSKVFPSFVDTSLAAQILQQFDVDQNGKLGWLEFKDAMNVAKNATKLKENC